MNRTILYVGWVGFGNQGDDVCYAIFVDSMSRQAKKQGMNLTINGIFPTNFNEFSLARMNPDLVVLGAGSLFEPVYLKPLVLAAQHSIPTAIWGSGYDSMLMSPIDPSRIDPDSAFMIRQVVQNATLIGVRGPYTMEMLEAIGATNPGLQIVGDPGLLLEKQAQEVSLPELESLHEPIIAVNWGTASNKVLGGDEKSVAEDLRTVLAELPKDYTIVVFPVWGKDIDPCRSLYAALDQPNTVLLDRVPTVDEMVDLYRRSTLSVNMKLHAGVFSASQCCPFVSLAYRMKCHDFASSLDWSEFSILFSDQDRRTKLRLAVEKLLAERARYTEILTSKKDIYITKLSLLQNNMVSLLLG